MKLHSGGVKKLRAKGKSGARILAQDENRNRNTVIMDGNMMINNRKVQLPFLRVIPQGTVDNSLGPDRLAGPNYCRQPTI